MVPTIIIIIMFDFFGLIISIKVDSNVLFLIMFKALSRFVWKVISNNIAGSFHVKWTKFYNFSQISISDFPQTFYVNSYQ